MVDRQDAQGEAPSHAAAEANTLHVALGAQAVVANIHVGLAVQEDVHVVAAPHAHHPAVASRHLAATDCGRVHVTESALSAAYRSFLSRRRGRDCGPGLCHGTVI